MSSTHISTLEEWYHRGVAPYMQKRICVHIENESKKNLFFKKKLRGTFQTCLHESHYLAIYIGFKINMTVMVNM